MQISKYEVVVQEDPVHSYTRQTIEEYWSSGVGGRGLGVCWNFAGGDLHYFESDKPRSSINMKKIKINNNMIDRSDRENTFYNLYDTLVKLIRIKEVAITFGLELKLDEYYERKRKIRNWDITT